MYIHIIDSEELFFIHDIECLFHVSVQQFHKWSWIVSHPEGSEPLDVRKVVLVPVAGDDITIMPRKRKVWQSKIQGNPHTLWCPHLSALRSRWNHWSISQHGGPTSGKPEDFMAVKEKRHNGRQKIGTTHLFGIYDTLCCVTDRQRNWRVMKD